MPKISDNCPDPGDERVSEYSTDQVKEEKEEKTILNTSALSNQIDQNIAKINAESLGSSKNPVAATTVGFCGSVGNTPLILIPSLSKLTGCEIYGKAEFLNPGGSIKDRAALWMINAAIAEGKLASGGLVIEATAGNTGVGLAHVCRAKNMRCIFICPDHVSDEKVNHLKLLGAEDVIRVERLPASDPGNYQNVAKRMAQEMKGICLDQYNNENNLKAHIDSTGPEIWEQTNHKIDALVLASGTGGTIAGCSVYLKQQNPNIQVYMANVISSGIALNKGSDEEKLKNANLAFSDTLRERYEEEKSGLSTVMEGIGSSQLYGNLSRAIVDGIVECSDESGVQMCHYMLKHEGIFVGGSAGINLVSAYLLAKKLGPGHRIVTFLCDNGSRYASKIFNPEWVKEKKFDVSDSALLDLAFLRGLPDQ